MLCRHCRLPFLLALSGCAQLSQLPGTGNSNGSDWVEITAICIHAPLFHKPWLTDWLYSTEHNEKADRDSFLYVSLANPAAVVSTVDIRFRGLYFHPKYLMHLESPSLTHFHHLLSQGQKRSPVQHGLLPLTPPPHLIEKP